MAASRERQGIASRQAADERAKALAPIVRELRGTGFVKLQAMADGLNKREVKTAYGGRWQRPHYGERPHRSPMKMIVSRQTDETRRVELSDLRGSGGTLGKAAQIRSLVRRCVNAR